ncbi:MAG: hypothetical protein PHR21_03225 [Oscillospiraceae bacterium]|nr:hypothetical protein [Oscillospiraceae bacterium]
MHDLIETLDETALAKNIQFAIQLVKDLAEAAVMPFPCRVPQDKKTELDRYFGRLDTSASALKA